MNVIRHHVAHINMKVYPFVSMIYYWRQLYPSVSILLSLKGICLVSGCESCLGLAELASISPSEDNVKAAVPEDDPNKRRTTGASAEYSADRSYVNTPIGWSNLQLGPNLHIPYRE